MVTEISEANVWDVQTSLSKITIPGLSDEDLHISIAASGTVGVGYRSGETSGLDWNNQWYGFNCDLREPLTDFSGGQTYFKCISVVPQISIATFRFKGDGDNGGFTLNRTRAFMEETRLPKRMRLEFEIGALAEGEAFIDRISFMFVATGLATVN